MRLSPLIQASAFFCSTREPRKCSDMPQLRSSANRSSFCCRNDSLKRTVCMSRSLPSLRKCRVPLRNGARCLADARMGANSLPRPQFPSWIWGRRWSSRSSCATSPNARRRPRLFARRRSWLTVKRRRSPAPWMRWQKESAPERLVEHLLRTIISQLDAYSSGVWLRNEAPGLVSFEFAFENGTLLTKSDAVLAKISPTLNIKDVWIWPEVFRTGKPSVLEDIREGPTFPWREHVLSLGVITILIVPMLIAGQVEGVIGIRFTRKRSFRAEELELAQALAHQAMLAIQLGRLSRQSRQAAVAAERNRMARDIHDTLAQGFTGVILQLEVVEEALSQRLSAKAGEHLRRASELARESLREARRSVWALRPQTLEEKDLCEALRGLIQKLTAGTPVRAEFIVQGKPRELPLDWEDNLLRIGQEVLTNALRHAQASEFNAQLAFDDGAVRLSLHDNGRGFDPAGRHDGFGLQGMRERVEGIGGQLAIQSARGEGTAISIVLPLAKTFHSG